jgi:hypothetical protein
MHFSEDDLRKALKRKDPGEGFTQRVMARVNQAKGESTAQPATKKVNGKFLAWWLLRPAWAVAVVAILLLAFGIGGYQYSEYRHAEEMRVARARQQRLQQEAERARDQAILALEIARAKLNHVLQHAQLQAEPNDKIRRERL